MLRILALTVALICHSSFSEGGRIPLSYGDLPFKAPILLPLKSIPKFPSFISYHIEFGITGSVLATVGQAGSLHFTDLKPSIEQALIP